jgi:hypothetical protein
MKIIVPITVTEAMLTDTSVAETDHTEWSSSTAYVAGNKVIRTTGVHRRYESLTSNTNKAPESNPTDWLDLGPTNRWSMFDQKVGTVTTATTSMTFELTPGQVVTSIALLEVEARTITVTVEDAVDGVVYSKEIDMEMDLLGADWWHWFFDPFTRRTSCILTDLPNYHAPVITVEIEGATAEAVECGALVIGTLQTFADAVLWGASVGITDYSRKTTDDFGNIEIVERSYAKRASWQFQLPRTRVDYLQRVLAELRAVPAVYIGGDYDATAIYGFFKEFSISITYPTHSECSIELEGLI